MSSLLCFRLRSLLVLFLFHATARAFPLSELTTAFRHRLKPLRVFPNRDGTDIVAASLDAILVNGEVHPDVVFHNEYDSAYATVFVLRVHRRTGDVIWATATESFTGNYQFTRDLAGDVYIYGHPVHPICCTPNLCKVSGTTGSIMYCTSFPQLGNDGQEVLPDSIEYVHPNMLLVNAAIVTSGYQGTPYAAKINAATGAFIEFTPLGNGRYKLIRSNTIKGTVRRSTACFLTDTQPPEPWLIVDNYSRNLHCINLRRPSDPPRVRRLRQFSSAPTDTELLPRYIMLQDTTPPGECMAVFVAYVHDLSQKYRLPSGELIAKKRVVVEKFCTRTLRNMPVSPGNNFLSLSLTLPPPSVSGSTLVFGLRALPRRSSVALMFKASGALDGTFSQRKRSIVMGGKSLRRSNEDMWLHVVGAGGTPKFTRVPTLRSSTAGSNIRIPAPYTGVDFGDFAVLPSGRKIVLLGNLNRTVPGARIANEDGGLYTTEVPI